MTRKYQEALGRDKVSLMHTGIAHIRTNLNITAKFKARKRQFEKMICTDKTDTSKHGT